MVDVVLFEFEGVIAETRARRTAALRRSLADDRISVETEELEAAFRALSTRAAAAAMLEERGERHDEVTLDLIALRAERYFADGAAGGLSLVEGARELIEALQERVRLGIVTRASRREVDFTLSLAGLDFAFECIVTADEVREQKPNPAGYARALDRLGRRRPVNRAAVVALEDGSAGIRAARAAGLRCIAVGEVPACDAVDADAYLRTLAGIAPQRLLALAGRQAGA